MYWKKICRPVLSKQFCILDILAEEYDFWTSIEFFKIKTKNIQVIWINQALNKIIFLLVDWIGFVVQVNWDSSFQFFLKINFDKSTSEI